MVVVIGITYQESETDTNTVSEIFALINGPEGTPYAGGKFRVKLVLSEDYPNRFVSTNNNEIWNIFS